MGSSCAQLRGLQPRSWGSPQTGVREHRGPQALRTALGVGAQAPMGPRLLGKQRTGQLVTGGPTQRAGAWGAWGAPWTPPSRKAPVSPVRIPRTCSGSKENRAKLRDNEILFFIRSPVKNKYHSSGRGRVLLEAAHSTGRPRRDSPPEGDRTRRRPGDLIKLASFDRGLPSPPPRPRVARPNCLSLSQRRVPGRSVSTPQAACRLLRPRPPRAH